MDSSSPALSGVSRWARKRMSSPLTKMFTKRRTCPDSSQMRSLIPGWRRSRSSTSAATVAPCASTPPAPPVYLRSGVGTLTCTMMTVPPSGCQSDGARRAGGVQASVKLVEVGEARRDAERLLDRVEHRLERLVAVARDADDDRFVARDAPLFDQLLGDRDRGAARGLGEDALGAGEEPDAGHDLLVGDRLAPAARLAHGLEHVEAVGRVADGDRLGDRLRLHGRDEIRALVERVHDRRAARRLRRVDLGVALG